MGFVSCRARSKVLLFLGAVHLGLWREVPFVGMGSVREPFGCPKCSRFKRRVYLCFQWLRMVGVAVMGDCVEKWLKVV